MFKWVFVLNLALECCLCANIIPMNLLDKTPESIETSSEMKNGMNVSGDSTNYTRIYGGSSAADGDIPFQVALMDNDDKEFPVFCGGTLVSPRVVVTSARCIPSNRFMVGIGGRDRRNFNIERHVSESIKYYDSTGNDGDIGVLILESNVPYTNNIKPAKLPACYDVAPTGGYAYVSGWGKSAGTFFGWYESYEYLQYARVKIHGPSYCRINYPQYTDNYLCAGIKGTRACSRDEGGPLYTTNDGTYRGDATLWGITSYGTDNCEGGGPVMYTKVSHYIGWIQKIAQQYGAPLRGTKCGTIDEGGSGGGGGGGGDDGFGNDASVVKNFRYLTMHVLFLYYLLI